MSIESVMPSNHLTLCPSPSSPTFNLSQHQSLFKWVSSSHQVAKVLEFQLQHQSFQWIFRTDFLYDGLVWSPCCPRDSQESSPTPQFKSISSSALSFLYSPTLTSIHDYWKIDLTSAWKLNDRSLTWRSHKGSPKYAYKPPFHSWLIPDICTGVIKLKGVQQKLGARRLELNQDFSSCAMEERQSLGFEPHQVRGAW